MTEILFYHLQRRPLDVVLPTLLEKSLARGWRVTLQASSDERIEALDAHLWTYSDPSFLPHGSYRERDAAEQPILLTIGEGNENGATVRFLVENVPLPANASQYERIIVLFEGADEVAASEARARWQEAKAAGFTVTYWRENDGGRWERQA